MRYTVVEPIAGTRAYRGIAVARDGTTRDVVIRQVLPSLPDPRGAALYEHDLRSVLRLEHANIVAVVDVGRTPERAYFVVTEYVEGCSLRTFVARQARVSIEHALHVAISCCDALACAHGLDILHRCIAPRTLLLTTTGDVKVADFGLAGASTQITDDHDEGRFFSYLAPETASGIEVDHRAGVFAVGTVLWELLTGRPLFLSMSDYHTVELVRAARIPSSDGLDPALDAIVRKALARDRNARFSHASELAHALREHATSRGIVSNAAGLAALVRDTPREVGSGDPSELARVQADVDRLISIREPSRWN